MSKKTKKGKKRDDGFGDSDEDEKRLAEKLKMLMSDKPSKSVSFRDLYIFHITSQN